MDGYEEFLLLSTFCTIKLIRNLDRTFISSSDDFKLEVSMWTASSC